MNAETTVRVRVLGSAAGGGFPQWNCGCANCRGAREGTVRAAPRTQECVALSVDDEHWFLLNASPEIRAQIEAFPPLWPRARRHSPIAGILLTSGDLDHTLGLLSLRESQPLALYATRAVSDGFRTDNVLCRTLERTPEQTRWHDLPLGAEVRLTLPSGTDAGLGVTALPVPGKAPLHLEGRRARTPEDNVALRIRAPGGVVLAYASGVAAWSSELDAALHGADCVFFDGTFWSNDELVAGGLGTRKAQDMAHWPVGGPEGSLAYLARHGARRRILIHVNNTNPILRDDGAERRLCEAAGVEVAHDGLELRL